MNFIWDVEFLSIVPSNNQKIPIDIEWLFEEKQKSYTDFMIYMFYNSIFSTFPYYVDEPKDERKEDETNEYTFNIICIN